jgi:hypothetical protein
MRLIKKLIQANKNMSPSELLKFLVGYPARKLKYRREVNSLTSLDSLKDRFTSIYELNTWGSTESVSGSGSTLAMTESIRASLPLMIKKFKVRTIFDAPCGDFSWMKLVDLKGIKYVGGDIVAPLINHLQINYSQKSVSFIQIDLTQESFPKSDLVINRDCLFHLSYVDILRTLQNFLESGSKYFLTTSHDNRINFSNRDIRSGDSRLIDLFASPFNFPRNWHFEIPEPGEGSLPSRKLYLWDSVQVQVAVSNLQRHLSVL